MLTSPISLPSENRGKISAGRPLAAPQDFYKVEVKRYSASLAKRKGSKLSDANDDLRDFEQWDWLEAIYGFVRPKGSSSLIDTNSLFGACWCALIKRDRMRSGFHHWISQPKRREITVMGFELFDRYGRLKPEFKNHPAKNGSGVWGDELDNGDLLLIDAIQIHKNEPVTFASNVVKAILYETRRKSSGFFAIAGTNVLNWEIADEVPNLTEGERNAVAMRQETVAVQILRSLGFRRIGASEWFALAGDSGHPCHDLSASKDYDMPELPVNVPSLEVQAWFKHIEKLEDTTCLLKLNGLTQRHRLDDNKLLSQNEDGNTLLHLAAINSKPKCVNWLVEQNLKLDQVRNKSGDTPLEALLNHLEGLRTQRLESDRIVSVSDQFSGFSDSHVSCLAILKGIKNPQHIQRMRLKYGCSCGRCISGVLSPRMLFALLMEAEKSHDKFHDAFHLEGEFLVDKYAEHLKYLPDSLRNQLRTDRELRQGFAQMCRYVATCLKNKVLPTEHYAVQAIVLEGALAPSVRTYIERGGTLGAVAAMMFTAAMKEDKWAGDGVFEEKHGDDSSSLPTCRNDSEFGFVSGMCGYPRVSQFQQKVVP